MMPIFVELLSSMTVLRANLVRLCQFGFEAQRECFYFKSVL